MVSGPPQTMQIMKAKRTFIPTSLPRLVSCVPSVDRAGLFISFRFGQANSNQAILLSIKLWPKQRREDCQHFAVILSLARPQKTAPQVTADRMDRRDNKHFRMPFYFGWPFDFLQLCPYAQLHFN